MARTLTSMSTEMHDRIFTLAEAKSLIPRLRSILGEAGTVWSRIKELQPQTQTASDNALYDGFSPCGVEYVECIAHLLFLLHQIGEMGVLLKDVDRGLCDFPYLRKGQVVYLCWHLGEDTIEYWHDIESGFAGRELLDETDL